MSIHLCQKPKLGGDHLIYLNIKTLCDQQGISIRSLEKQAGLGNGVIRRWEKSSPTVDKLQAVAKVLKVKIEKLIE